MPRHRDADDEPLYICVFVYLCICVFVYLALALKDRNRSTKIPGHRDADDKYDQILEILTNIDKY